MKPKAKGILAFLFGVLALLFYFLHDLLGGLFYPGYSWMTQAVSDITSVTSPTRSFAGILTKCYGASSILCCLLSLHLTKKEPKVLRTGIFLFLGMNLVSAFGYSLFPLTEAGSPSGFQNVMHLVVTALVVILSIASLLILFVGGLKHQEKALSLWALAAFLLMMAGAIGSNIAPKAVFGIVERFSTYAAAAFTIPLGWYAKSKAKAH